MYTQVMCMFPGTGQVYKSVNTIAEDDLLHTYPTEFPEFINTIWVAST